MIDTSAEAVERLAARHTSEADAWASDGAIHDLAKFHRASATTLHVLLVERDAALSAGRTMQEQRDAAIARAEAAEAALNAYAGRVEVRPALGEPAA